MYKVWANSLRPTFVETWEEAVTLRKMVQAASKSNVEPCHIEKIPDKQ